VLINLQWCDCYRNSDRDHDIQRVSMISSTTVMQFRKFVAADGWCLDSLWFQSLASLHAHHSWINSKSKCTSTNCGKFTCTSTICALPDTVLAKSWPRVFVCLCQCRVCWRMVRLWLPYNKYLDTLIPWYVDTLLPIIMAISVHAYSILSYKWPCLWNLYQKRGSQVTPGSLKG